ncbi:hypothetical protein LOCC1_G004264 [Lachnellula occidentalis]|uniref:NAD(P)-binding protein n=1 Tax=Lachnellula occidentalis TaxID=215460 RepID=A0A8H8S3Z8_9HELO|nr:hypothetical protein LOCC1_G004264 [Lachnellula occidentalis]
MAHQILLFLGAGSNGGVASIKKFKSKGYKVAAVSRNPVEEVKESADLVLSGDFNDPSGITAIFEKVERELGTPNVVIYNAYSFAPTALEQSDPNPLSFSIEGLIRDLNVNTVSPYAAAQEAVKRFAQLPSDVSKIFIYTGNKANTVVAPGILSFGMTKGATWYMIQSLVAAFKDSGYRFYYVDERTPDGKGMLHISGEAHAEFFLELAQRADQGPPLATFVRGKGYTAFAGETVTNLPVVSMAELADLDYGS